jgi:hypothetical protein
LIQDHINFLLGKHAASKKDIKTALGYFIKLLRKSRQSATNQRAYVNEFLLHYNIYSTNNINTDGIASQIPLPSLNDATIIIKSIVDPTVSSNLSNVTDDVSKWINLEKEAVNSYNRINKIKISQNSTKTEYTTVCAVGG